jgi:hypothetical protein
MHLEYPLGELAVDQPLDAMNEALREWMQERIDNKGVRYYAEPVYLFDE